MAAAEEGLVIAVHTDDHWKHIFQNAVDSKKLVVVDFTASWCGPCRFIAPVFAEIAKKNAHVTFLKVDINELKNVANEYEIEVMPTFLFFKGGIVVDKVEGARKEDLQDGVAKYGGAISA